MSASFRQLDYQDRVLSSLEGYLDTLKEKKAKAEAHRAKMAARMAARRNKPKATRRR